MKRQRLVPTAVDGRPPPHVQLRVSFSGHMPDM
jgi:hypothetical protein